MANRHEHIAEAELSVAYWRGELRAALACGDHEWNYRARTELGEAKQRLRVIAGPSKTKTMEDKT